MSVFRESAPTLEELTTEQKENTSPEYLAAVNAALEEALASVARGEVLDDVTFWAEFEESSTAKPE